MIDNSHAKHVSIADSRCRASMFATHQCIRNPKSQTASMTGLTNSRNSSPISSVETLLIQLIPSFPAHHKRGNIIMVETMVTCLARRIA